MLSTQPTHRQSLPGSHLTFALGTTLDHVSVVWSRPMTIDTVTIKITPNDKANPPGKLADAELHFSEGLLNGLKRIGFSIWERRGGNGRNVTFPARAYAVNGERRSFALLRPVADSTAQSPLREKILEAFQEYEERSAIAS